MDRMMKPSQIRTKARLNLVHAQNCAQATLLTLGEALQRPDPVLTKAATNFEGGCVGCGSTCGVVSGGVLGIGALLSCLPNNDPRQLEEDIYEVSIAYRQSFERRFGTSVCHERVGVDFGTLGGLLSYLFPGHKLLRCIHHIGEALVCLSDEVRQATERKNLPLRFGQAVAGGPSEPHCAYTVFKAVAARSGSPGNAVGWACTGLGGGVALGGAVCGGLLGAILGLGLKYGYDPASMGFGGILRAFVAGHRNLVRHQTLARGPVEELPQEAFARSRYLADRFEERFGSLNCKEITGRGFASPDELREFLPGSEVCGQVFSWCEQEGARLMTV
jgi:Putative redox-active protein (C_GCAxxG_C_C)